MKEKQIAWCVTVGEGNNAYIMDNKVFDYKREAIAYRKQAGYPSECSWSNIWHISKLTVIK